MHAFGARGPLPRVEQVFNGTLKYTQAELDRAVAEAVAAEREACAALCDRLSYDESGEPEYDRGYAAALSHVLKDIRARGEVKP